MRRLLLLCLLALPVGCSLDDSSSGNDSTADASDSADSSPDAASQLPDAADKDRSEPEQDGSLEEASVDSSLDGSPEAQVDAEIPDSAPEASTPTSCGFNYDTEFGQSKRAYAQAGPAAVQAQSGLSPHDQIVHLEPRPAGTHRISKSGLRKVSPDDLTMPNYQDSLALFDRAQDWTSGTRCYETPSGVQLLTQEQAYDLYQQMAERTTGVAMNTAAEVRTVIGIRGAYPGTFTWHENAPDRFNDTIVLLWKEQSGAKHVLEFPINTDTGAYEFGYHNSSSLRPNRRYYYVNGWHYEYNALHIDEDGYRVRDDANKNGHWDSDRNGWLGPGSDLDHDRTGGGHNIHMGSVDSPLGTASVGGWSAGCQVIPGMANWTQFITNAWTAMGDRLNYFLLDARDIAPEVWSPCTPDGSHSCPFHIDSLPFSDSRDTSASSVSQFPVYNCSQANESGPEYVYVVSVDREGTLSVSVDCQSPVDVDIYLLDGDDQNACLMRADKTFQYYVTPGRYFIVADTYVLTAGQVQSGGYTLHVSLD